MTEEYMMNMLEKVMQDRISKFLESEKGQEMLQRSMLCYMEKMLSSVSEKQETEIKSKNKTSMTKEEFFSLSEDYEYKDQIWNERDNFEYQYRSLESRLMKKGYSVAQNSGKSNFQRQQMLKNWIEAGEFTKQEILAHLKYLIKINGQSKKNEVATIKWKMDMDFVRKL